MRNVVNLVVGCVVWDVRLVVRVVNVFVGCLEIKLNAVCLLVVVGALTGAGFFPMVLTSQQINSLPYWLHFERRVLISVT